MTAPVEHRVSASTSGGRGWVARCSCSWWTPCTGRHDAEERMHEHHELAKIRSLSPHSCYFAEEYEPEHCVACIVDPLLTPRRRSA